MAPRLDSDKALFLRRRAAERGATLVEVALASIVFLMLIVGILDYGKIHYMRSRLQHAVSQSARFAVVGRTLDDPDKPGEKLSRDASIAYLIKKISGLNGLADKDIDIRAVDRTGRSAKGAGGAGDIVTVQATYRVKVLAPYLAPLFENRQYEFTSSTTFKNEEFTSGT